MIISSKNYCPFLSNKTDSNLSRIQNINLANKNTLSFSGKDFVLQKIFGEIVEIPMAVHKAKLYSRSIAIKINENLQHEGNVVSLGDKNFYIGVKHYLKPDSDKVLIGTYPPKEKSFYPLEYGNVIKTSDTEDLAIFKSGFWFSSKLKPIKMATSMPELGETVYITGRNPSLGTKKAIPAEVVKKEVAFKKVMADDELVDAEETYHYKLYSDVLKMSKDYSFPGLSGSPVFNKNGELIGIIDWAETRKGHILYFIDINTIKKFLDENKTQIWMAKNIPCFSALKKKFSKLSLFKE